MVQLGRQILLKTMLHRSKNWGKISIGDDFHLSSSSQPLNSSTNSALRINCLRHNSLRSQQRRLSSSKPRAREVVTNRTNTNP
jgi:hypothetical protein